MSYRKHCEIFVLFLVILIVVVTMIVVVSHWKKAVETTDMILFKTFASLVGKSPLHSIFLT